MLRAAIARMTITPPTGMRMVGYAGREGVCQGIDEDLTATALIMEDSGSRVALIGLDLAFTPEPLATRLRRVLAEELQTEPSHILINSSHSHCTPTLTGFHYDDDPEQDRKRAAFEDSLAATVGRLAAQANAKLEPARLGTATGEARIGVNRREVDSNGTVILGENPCGPVDHEVRVIRVDDLQGRPLAVAFAHGCHTVTMGPKCLRWSPDYVGPARRVLDNHLGCLSVFLQANAGDINPVTGIGTSEDNSNEKNRLGRILGGEALKVHSEIYTESERGERVFFGTLAKASVYPRIPIRNEPSTSISVSEVPFAAPLQTLPDRETARVIAERCRGDYEAAIASGSVARQNIARRYLHWTKALLQAVERGDPSTLSAAIQVIRIGGLALASFPGETFAALGMEVKRRSPFVNTLFLGYTNGCICYIPTPDAFPVESWSPLQRYHVPDMIFQAYAVPVALRREVGDMVVDRVVELLQFLHSTA